MWATYNGNANFHNEDYLHAQTQYCYDNFKPPFFHDYMAKHAKFFMLNDDEVSILLGLDGIDKVSGLNFTESNSPIQQLRDYALALLAVKLGVGDAEELNKFPELKKLALQNAQKNNDMPVVSSVGNLTAEPELSINDKALQELGNLNLVFCTLQMEYIFRGLSKEEREVLADKIISSPKMQEKYLESSKALLNELINIDDESFPKPLLTAAYARSVKEWGVDKELFANISSPLLGSFVDRKLAAFNNLVGYKITLSEENTAVVFGDGFSKELSQYVSSVLNELGINDNVKQLNLAAPQSGAKKALAI